MTPREALAAAVAADDAATVARIAEAARRKGYRHADLMRMAERAGCDPADVEALLYQADSGHGFAERYAGREL